jgi:hypothetical protein
VLKIVEGYKVRERQCLSQCWSVVGRNYHVSHLSAYAPMLVLSVGFLPISTGDLQSYVKGLGTEEFRTHGTSNHVPERTG